MSPALENVVSDCPMLNEPLEMPVSDQPYQNPDWQQDWFELALQVETPVYGVNPKSIMPRASWGDDEDEDLPEETEEEEEIEADPFDDFDEEDFDDDFDDDFEEELEDEYEIEPADDGAATDTVDEDIEEIELDEEIDLDE